MDMVDVFISYSRTNKDRVSQIARAIEHAGYEVWWDAELPPHQSYGDVITAKIQMAKAAVVVWSAEAAASEWVRAEADVARNQKKLVQTALGDITPPLPFNQIQYANLGDWNGEQDHPEWRKVKASLADLCGPRDAREGGPAYPFPPAPPAEPAAARPAPVAAAAMVASPAAAPAGGNGAAVPRSGGVPVPVVVGGLVALLGLAGAAWWVSSSGAKGDEADPTEEVAGADGEAQALVAAPSATPSSAPTPTPSAPPPAPVQQAQAAPPPQQQQQYNRDVRLINQSGDTIMYLRWSDANQSDYGADRLGSDVLGNGEYWDVTIDDGTGACTYDLMATTAGGRNIARNGVNVCAVSSVTFN
ncbi:toll/interleukin-1 receptor domain-containing protein [Alteraurantiacibacter buctensis]|uniref:TIR domain-containing protein n=1 Tax=Alteraurantiacibacter buctensis TaxID=1503981 RepID=A0A844YUI0_9SPHN|nr:toll/interleukin-1 receptor domain-containing protein [Alteraurantiacibacter buctensis]MXO70762.1 TIR domain-containing protein [Alteraurantiacibacter buctensis]